MLNTQEMTVLEAEAKKVAKSKNGVERLMKFINDNLRQVTALQNTFNTRDRKNAVQKTHDGRKSLSSDREINLGVKVRTQAESSQADAAVGRDYVATTDKAKTKK